MGMAAPCPMRTDADLPSAAILTLMQWLSPGFPLGSFSYSHGLEQAVADGRIRTAADLQAWLTTILADGSGRNDAILMTEAYRCDDPTAVDALARALVTGQERLLETTAQGAAFCDTVNAVWEMTLPPLVLPVAVGAAARQQDLPLDLTLQTYLHAFAASLVSAAQRCMPLGQTAAQTVLARMAPLCQSLSRTAAASSVDDLGGCAFLADIAAMRHETLQPRIFRS